MSYLMFDIVFYGVGVFLVIIMIFVIMWKSLVYVLLNFVMLIFGIVFVIYVLGVLFVVLLEVIVYVGVVVVLFFFVVMMFNLEYLSIGFVNNWGWMFKLVVLVVLVMLIMIEIGVVLSGGCGKEMLYYIIGFVVVGCWFFVVDIILIELGLMLLLVVLLGVFYFVWLLLEKVW